MTTQLAAILANQRLDAARFGDADRIAWWAARDITTPETH